MLKIKSYVAIFLLVFAVVAFTPPILQSTAIGQNTGEMSPANCATMSCSSCFVFVSGGACWAEKYSGTKLFTSCFYDDINAPGTCDQTGLTSIYCDSGTGYYCNGSFQGGCVFDNCNCDSQNGVFTAPTQVAKCVLPTQP